MPSFSSLALFSLAALGAVAAPAERRQAPVSSSQCMTDAEADQVATAWGTLIASYNDALADAVLTENFTDYSESVNTLINSCPQGDAAKPLDLLAASFTSREQFKIGQGQQPAINFNRLNIWPGCTSVNIRWMTTNTAPIPNPKPVVGLIAMEVVKNTLAGAEYPWLISTWSRRASALPALVCLRPATEPRLALLLLRPTAPSLLLLQLTAPSSPPSPPPCSRLPPTLPSPKRPSAPTTSPPRLLPTRQCSWNVCFQKSLS
jgi:hypothetical protein